VTESEREWFEERAAIREYDGGATRKAAEVNAANDLERWKRAQSSKNRQQSQRDSEHV
jgi:hypothetical protein